MKLRLLGLGLVVSCLVTIGVVGSVSATWSPSFKSSDMATLKKGETHNGSFYVTGNTVTIDGIVTGSLYCAGSAVTINGTVDGDVLCAGQKVTINGTVGQDVRAAGQFVQVNGTIGGSLTAFGQDVQMGKDARIDGDVNGAGQQFTLEGTVGRDVAIGTQMLTLSGEVKGNVDVAVEQLQVGDSASVLGNFNYSASKELSIDASRVQGSVSFNPKENNHQDGRQFAAMAKMTFLFMLAVSAFIMMLIAPRFIDRSSELFAKQRLMTILLGFAAVFGTPIVAAFLLASFILVPLGVVLFLGWFSMLILSNIFFAYWIGAELLRSQSNTLVRMLGGIVVLFVVYMIPFINVLVMFVATIVGSGMIVATFTNGYKRPSYTAGAKKAVAAKSK